LKIHQAQVEENANQIGYKIYKRETVRGLECELIMRETSPVNTLALHSWDDKWIERIASFAPA